MSTKAMRSMLCAAAAALATFAHAGTTYCVNGTSGNDDNAGTEASPFKTIGKALSLAADSDRIEVAAGTYAITETLYVTSAVEIVGTGATRTDVLVTSYDAGQVRPLVVSNALAKVSGIKFRGGHSRWGAGIYPANCAWVYSGTVTNCVFADSWMCSNGYGGVMAETEDAYVLDCEICGHYNFDGYNSNPGSLWCAAGLTLKNGTARGCYVHDNVSRQNTGGVLLSGPKARLLDSTVTGNVACGYDRVHGYAPWKGYGAGGILFRDAGAVVSNCVVTANVSGERVTAGDNSYYKAGGIWFSDYGGGKVYNTVITGNTSASEGGGVWGSGLYSIGSLYNCVIADNVAQYRTGGGVYGKVALCNCTVTGNDSQLAGGADGIEGGGSSAKATVENSIVYGNGTVDTGANVTLTATWTDDPKFRDAAAGDYQLAVDSPCIDAGLTAAKGLPTLDAAGKPRTANGSLDYGALEAQSYFRVIGDPETFGVPATPAFGTHYDMAAGTVKASVPSPYADESGLTNIVCTGYTYVARDNANGVTTDAGEAAAYAAAYERIGELTWHLTTKYMQTAATRGGGAGTVTGAGLVEKDADFTLTATPAAGDCFWRWEGDIGEADPSSPTITLTADFARKVTAVFGRIWYVSTKGDDSADGRTSETAKLTPSKLVPQTGDGDIVYFAAGTYTLPNGAVDYDYTTLTLTNAVRLVGLGESRSDVVVKSTNVKKVGRPLRVANPDARVENMKFWGIEDKWISGSIQGQCALVESGMVTNCVFYGSTLLGAYAGVVLKNADAVAVDCEIRDHFTYNQSSEAGGLAIYEGLALNCLVCDNNERSNSGGVSLNGAGARLIGCVVTNNGSHVPSPRGLHYPNNTYGSEGWRTGGGTGGGVVVQAAGAVISNCVIACNQSARPASFASGVTEANYLQGGGIMFNKAGKVYATVISGNRAFNEGGAVAAASGVQPELYNCLIYGNSTSNKTAGAVYGQVKLYNCTITDNRTDFAGGVGGVVGFAADKKATLVNTIVWGNTVKGTLANYADAAMTYSCTTPLAEGDGNIASDPQLKCRKNRGMYYIDSMSPCAKTGQWQSWMSGLKYLNGVDMPTAEGKVPMGCYAPYKANGMTVIIR